MTWQQLNAFKRVDWAKMTPNSHPDQNALFISGFREEWADWLEAVETETTVCTGSPKLDNKKTC